MDGDTTKCNNHLPHDLHCIDLAIGLVNNLENLCYTKVDKGLKSFTSP